MREITEESTLGFIEMSYIGSSVGFTLNGEKITGKIVRLSTCFGLPSAIIETICGNLNVPWKGLYLLT